MPADPWSACPKDGGLKHSKTTLALYEMNVLFIHIQIRRPFGSAEAVSVLDKLWGEVYLPLPPPLALFGRILGDARNLMFLG